MMRPAILLTFLMALPAAADDSPRGRTESLVGALQSAKKGDTGSFEVLDGYFDFDRLASDAIKTHRSKLTAAQYAEFAAGFRALLRLIGYPDSGDFLRKAKRTLKAVGENDVLMEAVLEEDDVEVEITFRWARTSGGLRVYDVAFDGDSLTGDYDNQFGRIIAKRGVDGLLKLLRERLAKERAGP